ncbi:MAG TPA: alcohol dehydrogenase catalytic domain-containing protein [Ktedonobacterales bacterium]|nr:alcohol dehydrogenase catalytic domain-containing protein [Ktedonobacterales bacterium]
MDHRRVTPVGSHDVLVQTRAAAISVGSELPVYRGDARSGRPPQYPRSMGYESLGIVVARGSAVQQVLRIAREELISTFEQLAASTLRPVKVLVFY